MRYKWLGLVVAFGILVGCSGKESQTLDPTNTARTLQNMVTLTDQMIEKDKESTCTFYDISPDLVSDASSIVGSGATAESISVWQATDTDAAEKIVEGLETFTKNWKDGYADYKPEEVPKLETACLKQKDIYVIYCVTADNDAATEAIDSLLS